MDKKIIKGNGYEELPQKGNVSPFIQYLFINSANLGLSAYTLRFLGILSLNLKDKQLLRTANGKRELAEFDEMTDFTKDSGFSFDISFKYSDFLPKGNRNISGVKTAIEELQHNLFTISFEKTNEKGVVKKYTLRSALISSFVTDNTQGFKISINAYWYRVLINLTTRYNQFPKEVLYKLSHNAIIMYFYIQTLPSIEEDKIEEFEKLLPEEIILNYKKLKGTIKKTEDIMMLLESNKSLKKPSQIINRVFEPLRSELNLYADASFNYKIDKSKTSLVVYDLGDKNKSNEAKTYSSFSKVKSSFVYQLNKAQLNEIEAYILLEIYTKFTYKTISSATARKLMLKDQKGRNFLNTFELLIKNYIDNYKVAKLHYNTYEDKKLIREGLTKLLRTETFKTKIEKHL